MFLPVASYRSLAYGSLGTKHLGWIFSEAPTTGLTSFELGSEKGFERIEIMGRVEVLCTTLDQLRVKVRGLIESGGIDVMNMNLSSGNVVPSE